MADEVNPRKRRARPNQALRWIAWCLVVAWLLYVFVAPEIELGLHVLRKKKLLPPSHLSLPLTTKILLRTLEFLSFGWFFYVGASLGSFLNVVAWRMPRGISFVQGGSRCPYCDHPLRFFDNLPIYGWLRLRGRCRDCRLPISPRYLKVEIVLGSVFLTLAIAQLLSGGASLPLRPINNYTGVMWVLFHSKWDLIGTYAFHVSLFCLFITAALIHHDGKPIPIGLLSGGVLLGLVPILAPNVMLIPWHWPWIYKQDWTSTTNAALYIGAGALAGLMMGTVSFGLNRKPSLIWVWLVIGACFGWQSVLTVSLVWIALALAFKTVAIKRPATDWKAVDGILVALFLHQLAWRLIYQGISWVVI